MAKEVFIYDLNATHKVFPIDFSLREFDSEHNGNFKRAQDMVQHPLLQNTLVNLIYPVEHQNSDYENGGIYPLPVEAETFLRCFYIVMGKKKYHSTTKRQKDLVGTDLGEEFSEDLYREIVKHIFFTESSEQYDDIAYCRRILCSEDSFCNIAMDTWWNDEISTRINQIKLLVPQVSPTQQIKVLQSVLLALDTACLELIHEKQPESATPVKKLCSPDILLEKLLSKREKVSSKYEKAAYKVNNPTIAENHGNESKSIKLETAFYKLENHRNPDQLLMKQARSAYLSSLEKMVEQSPFEEQYLKLQRYMDVTNKTPDLSELKQVFTEIMKKQCQHQIEKIMKTFKNESVPRQENGYLDSLIYNAAYLRAQQGIGYFENALELVSMFSNMAERGKKMEGKYTKIHMLCSDGTECKFLVELPPYVNKKCYFLQLQEFFVHYWVFFGHSSPIDKAGYFINIEDIANEFAHAAQEAAKFLGKGEELVHSEEETLKLLQFCEDSVIQADDIMSVNEIAALSFPILAMAILQTLQHIVISGVSNLLKDFSVFQQIQKQVRE